MKQITLRSNQEADYVFKHVLYTRIAVWAEEEENINTKYSIGIPEGWWVCRKLSSQSNLASLRYGFITRVLSWTPYSYRKGWHEPL